MDHQNNINDDLDLIFRPATSITSRPIEWLWPGLIPRGALTVFDGDPGAAKSTLLADIAARVSAGRVMPESDYESSPLCVLWLGAEDDSAATQSNLRFAGANLDRVKIYDKRFSELMFPDAAAIVERSVVQNSVGIVVVDPITSFINGSPNSESAVRKALGPLTAMAERTNAAVCIVRHLAKARGRSALHTGAGSIGIVAVARSAILVGVEPGDYGRRVAAQYKSNAGPLSRPLAFKVVDEAGGRRLEWLGSSEYSAKDLVTDAANDLSAVQEAAVLLIAILTDGPLLVSDIRKAAANSGVSTRTLERAKKLLRVTSHREGFGVGSQVYWRLPEQSVLVTLLKERELDSLMDSLVNGQVGLSIAPTENPPVTDINLGDDADEDWFGAPA